jgi:hypothetical protein
MKLLHLAFLLCLASMASMGINTSLFQIKIFLKFYYFIVAAKPVERQLIDIDSISILGNNCPIYLVACAIYCPFGPAIDSNGILIIFSIFQNY